MSQEDIFEVERLEKDALERYEAQGNPSWRELTEGYIRELSRQTIEVRETLLEVAQETLKCAELIHALEERMNKIEEVEE